MNEMLYYDIRESTGLTHSLSTQVAREIGRRIVAEVYAIGDLLEDEGALADKFQVSRSVVRDAVKILVGKGLLEVRRGIGTRVRPRSDWGLLDDDVLAWHQSAPPKAEFLRDLMDLRIAFEPKAARWAAERGSDDALAEIEKAQLRMEEKQDAIEDFVSSDAKFHRAVMRAANNDFLRSMEGAILSALLSSIRLTNRDPRENATSIPFHRAITNAILARDGDQAEEQMLRHLQDAQKRLGGYLHDA